MACGELRTATRWLSFGVMVLSLGVGLLLGAFSGGGTNASDTGMVFASEGMRLTAYFEGERVRLVFGDETEVVLPQRIAASGARFTDGSTLFWTKGDEARLELHGATYQLRVVDPETDPWERAGREGVHFRAIGQEPGWFLEIRDGERIDLALDYGETRITTPISGPELDPASETATYRTPSPYSPLDILVTIHRQMCRDVMSGEPFPYAVVVQLGGSGFRYEGCGRRL